MARSPLFHIIQKLLKSSSKNSPENPSRRTFVKAAVLSGTTCLLPDPSSLLPRLKYTKPVVILGAGAAGLAAAYELRKKHIPFVIYEASNRHGGRVLTKKNFNSDGMFCELGAELIDSNHHYIFSLAKELSVEMEKFNKDGLINHAFYFQDRFLTEEDISVEFGKLVHIMQQDLNRIFQGQSDRTVNYLTHSQVAKHFDQMDLETYLRSITNIDPLILEMVRVAYSCEFGLDTHQQSSLNLLLLMDPEINMAGELYGSSDEGWRVKNGNSTLMDALAVEVNKAEPIHYNHRLVSMREVNSKMVLDFENSGINRVVVCDQVICTIPFSILNKVDGIKGLDLSERKRYAIENFPMGSNTKLISGFNSRFWTNKETYPNNYFHGQLCTQFESQFFWDSSRDQKGRSGILTNYTGGSKAKNVDSSYYEKAVRDFSHLYPEGSSYLDGNQALANWNLNPNTLGSYACPSPGSYTTYLGSLALPELRKKLHFAGEHTSEESQGFIHGALESGRDAASAVSQLLANSL